MLSELCVKRPVFATMLVMSLVVLGIFSFRDLGVDLFPRADPATVNVSLTLPGASAAVQLHTHQKSGVWRILQTDNTLLGHVVGAGKTYTMVAAAMELKRLRLANKPLFAVPNHMLGQFSSELLTLYPSANILATFTNKC